MLGHNWKKKQQHACCQLILFVFQVVSGWGCMAWNDGLETLDMGFIGQIINLFIHVHSTSSAPGGKRKCLHLVRNPRYSF